MNIPYLKVQKKSKHSFVMKYIAVLCFTFLCAILTYKLWSQYAYIYHTVLELVCIFITLSMFLIVWYTYDRNLNVNCFVAFGFLIVTIFNIFHTLFHPYLNIAPLGYDDLGTRYSVLGKLSESVLLLSISLDTPNVKVDKWVGVSLSLLFALGISILIFFSPGVLPSLYYLTSGFTPIKNMLEFLIILILFISIYNNIQSKGNRSEGEVIAHRYILLALFIVISAELCFALFNEPFPFNQTYGHLLRIVYYFCLFRGVFVSTVTYPYIQLEKRNEFITDILDQLPTGLAMYNNEDKLTFANRKALNIMGCPIDEIQGLTAGQIVEKYHEPDKDLENIAAKITRKNLKLIKNKIVSLRRKDGNIIKLTSDFYHLKDGQYIHIFGEAEKEQELENLRLQTRTILNSISNLVLVADKESNVIMCNKAFLKAVEMESKDVLGMKLYDLDNMIYFTRNKATQKVLDVEGLNRVFEASFTPHSGNKRELLIHSGDIYNVNNEFIGSIFVGSDITSLKQEQQKLQQQERLALIGRMASGIVHEIKSPLTAIKGFSQVLKVNFNDSKILEYSNLIEGSANDINRFVVSLLDLAKPHHAAFREVSLNRLIEEIQLIIRDYLAIKNIKTQFAFSKDEKVIIGDKNKLKQVIMNIITNAVDAMSEVEDQQLTIRTQHNAAMYEMSVIISDTGKGMSIEEKSRIGTPFYTTKGNGTGLGLSICYQIVNEHKGSINVESERGKGTTFTLVFSCKNTTEAV